MVSCWDSTVDCGWSTVNHGFPEFKLRISKSHLNHSNSPPIQSKHLMPLLPYITSYSNIKLHVIEAFHHHLGSQAWYSVLNKEKGFDHGVFYRIQWDSIQFIIRINKNKHACYESHILYLTWIQAMGVLSTPRSPTQEILKPPQIFKITRSTIPTPNSKGETCIGIIVQ